MKPKLQAAWGYQGDAMNLPVTDVDRATPFYVEKLGFRVDGREDLPHRKVILGRDGIQMALVENGGDASQDGCAFQVSDAEALKAEFNANGFAGPMEIGEEDNDNGRSKVFYVVAPDGLCFWFGEPLP